MTNTPKGFQKLFYKGVEVEIKPECPKDTVYCIGEVEYKPMKWFGFPTKRIDGIYKKAKITEDINKNRLENLSREREKRRSWNRRVR